MRVIISKGCYIKPGTVFVRVGKEHWYPEKSMAIQANVMLTTEQIKKISVPMYRVKLHNARKQATRAHRRRSKTSRIGIAEARGRNARAGRKAG